MLNARAPLIAGVGFGAELSAEDVLAALARGLERRKSPPCDVCALPADAPSGELQPALEALDFERRMRAARALILALPSLSPRTLPGSAAFEVATRARQAGVPCYAVTAENTLSTFDERILDLQVVLLAGDAGALTTAGRELAGLIAQS
jgi:hypothetical protein